jgi:Expansin C-terminal domain
MRLSDFVPVCLSLDLQNVAGRGDLAQLLVTSPELGVWIPLNHTYGGVFETGAMPGRGPWGFKIILTDGSYVSGLSSHPSVYPLISAPCPAADPGASRSSSLIAVT